VAPAGRQIPVDTSGALPAGKMFDGPVAMRQVLLDRLPDFARCLIEKMMIYSLGRGTTPADRRAIEQIETKWAANGFGFQTLIYEVANSAPFQWRRGEVLKTDNPKNKEVAEK
jgi:hypothetical protein